MLRKYLFALILSLVLSACGAAATVAPTAAPTTAPVPTLAPAPTAAPAADSTTIIDVAGRSVMIAGLPQKIISLAPSNTEILFALGLGPQILAVDDFSDYPAEAKGLPKVGGSNGTYNFEQIVAFEPDLVLVGGLTPPEVVKQLEDLKLTVVVANSAETTFESILTDIGLVGQITGRASEAEQLTAALRQRFEEIKAKAATASTKPRVYWEIDATDAAKPYTVGPGNFVNDLIAVAGGINVFSDVESPFPQVGLEQVAAANPEVIILADAAYGITVESVLARPGWGEIAAVKQKQVYPIDDNLVSRPGPRIVDGLEAVAKLVHPELFP